MKKLLLAMLILCASVIYAGDEFMQPTEIKPGMKGIGYTVFENNKIESFGVEVLEVVYNYFPSRSVIIVKLIGDRVEHTGVASGMSGSPIYINNKLVGALAFRFGNFMKDPIAGVTPIHEMLKIFEKEKLRKIETADRSLPGRVNNTKNFSNRNGARRFDLITLLKSKISSQFENFQPIKMPLIISGLQPQIYEKLAPELIQTNFELLPGGKVARRAQTNFNVSLKPGEAVSSALIHGDFDISAMGTVTYRDGKKILAFGHPLFDSGPVNLPMAKSSVITTLSSMYASNKFGTTTDIIGTIRQDRSTGIMGVLGEMPSMIPVAISFSSPIFKEKQFHLNLVNDPSNYSILPVFFWISLVNIIESVRLANSDYALQLNGKIEIDGYDNVVLSNLYAGGQQGFFSGKGTDISEAAYDIAMTLRELLINKFQITKIKQIELHFRVIPGQKTAMIEKVFFNKNRIKPGDTLSVFIQLKPYHREIIELQKQIIIPETIEGKRLILAVGGGAQIMSWERKVGIIRSSPQNFIDLIRILNQSRKNNEIILQLKMKDQGGVIHGKDFPTLPPSILDVLNQKKADKSYQPVKEKILKEWNIITDFSIQGGRLFKLRVKDNLN